MRMVQARLLSLVKDNAAKVLKKAYGGQVPTHQLKYLASGRSAAIIIASNKYTEKLGRANGVR
jgi:hypothetical protein